jgi:hypothetical protein
MNRYDPDLDPPAQAWLELDEQEQINLVEHYHRVARIKVPNAKLHAIIHTIVETQLAQQIPEVRRTFERLHSEGLDRHETIHAIGLVLAIHMNSLLSGSNESEDANSKYFADLEALTAATWRAS